MIEVIFFAQKLLLNGLMAGTAMGPPEKPFGRAARSLNTMQLDACREPEYQSVLSRVSVPAACLHVSCTTLNLLRPLQVDL